MLILLDSGNLVRTSSPGITSLSKEGDFPMELPGLTDPSAHTEVAGSSKVSLVHPWKTRLDTGQWSGRRAAPPVEWCLNLGFKTAVFLEMCSIHLKKKTKKQNTKLNKRQLP